MAAAAAIVNGCPKARQSGDKPRFSSKEQYPRDPVFCMRESSARRVGCGFRVIKKGGQRRKKKKGCGKTGVPKRTGTAPAQTTKFTPVPYPHTLPGRYVLPVSHKVGIPVLVQRLDGVRRWTQWDDSFCASAAGHRRWSAAPATAGRCTARRTVRKPRGGTPSAKRGGVIKRAAVGAMPMPNGPAGSEPATQIK